MKGNGNREAKWLAVLCVLGALLIGAFIGGQISQPTVTEADWIESIQSSDTN